MDEGRKKHWLNRDAWEGWQAASLLHGYDPTIDATARAAHDGDFKAVFPATLQLLSDAAAMGKLKEETNRSSFIENLNFVLYPNYNKLYDPKEIIKWAANKDFPNFPFTMTNLVSGGNDEKPLTSVEKNSLLVIIAALLKELNVDPGAAGTASWIDKLTVDIGARVTDDTILKRLREIPEALERRMK